MAASAAGVARPYQLVVWGASGFTGRLVAEHLVRDYGEGRVRWALAGRDQAKLEGVRAELAKINPAAKDVPILVADAKDKAQVARVLGQTQVVVSTAGPFALVGDNVVEAALEQGTHYCDITGEVPWVKRSIKKHDAEARRKGVKIVHCAGYDSTPFDLGAFMMVDHLRKLGKKTAKVWQLVRAISGGVSGGTIASGMNIVVSEPPSELRACSTDAYYLAEALPGCKRGTATPAPMIPAKADLAGEWAAPFIMEGCNGRIVQMSNQLAPGGPYGSDFQYQEMIGTGKGWAGWASSLAATAAVAAFGLGFATPPGRALFKMILPAQGQGPSEATRKGGSWRNDLYAVAEGEPNKVYRGMASDPSRDPGYWSTSRMLLEAGLCLALDADKLHAAGHAKGGCLTPAAAMGMLLVERLRAAGQIWKVLE